MCDPMSCFVTEFMPVSYLADNCVLSTKMTSAPVHLQTSRSLCLCHSPGVVYGGAASDQ